jgi:glycosyltransferase involved in cell wall biosynthesis
MCFNLDSVLGIPVSLPIILHIAQLNIIIVQPLISIVIPTKNSANTLDDCLQSIINQTYSKLEIVIVDSQSTDDTLDIARKYSAMIVETQWGLLGARFLGFKASKGDYILYLDSDQILVHSNVLECSLPMFSNNDMLCLAEESSRTDSLLQKLIAADRKLVNKYWERNIDPLSGFFIPRFYKRCILNAVFEELDIVHRMHEIGINEDCLIYYHAHRLSHSSRIGVVSNALLHMDLSSLIEYFRKNYIYGQHMKSLVENSLYKKLILRNVRFRKGLTFDFQSLQSVVLRILKIVPFLVGLAIGRTMPYTK